MTDVIYENPEAPLPEWAQWMVKSGHSYFIYENRPTVIAQRWHACGESAQIYPDQYRIDDHWVKSLRRIIRLGDPDYYVLENPHTDDEGFLPHDGGPIPEWCYGKPTEIKFQDGSTVVIYPDSGLTWNIRIKGFRIVADAEQDGAESRQGKHPSHETRSSDASSFDEICEKCGATDIAGGGWGRLAEPCPAQDGSRDRRCMYCDKPVSESDRAKDETGPHYSHQDCEDREKARYGAEGREAGDNTKRSAFPSAEANENTDPRNRVTGGGLTQADYAAIHLGVPVPGSSEWLRGPLREARRVQYREAALQGYIAHLGAQGIHASGFNSECGSEAIAIADAMLDQEQEDQ